MTLLKHILLLIFSFPIVLSAGNLIPNPGFESFSKCPKRLGEIEKVDFWSSANGGTPDYFNICYTRDLNTTGIPNNYFGTQAVYAGQAYAGIYAGKKETEYLQVQLQQTLEAGKKYCLRFRASPLSATGNQMQALRVLMTDTKLAQEDWGPIEGIGTPFRPDYQPNRDPSRWVLMTSTYEARGGEQFLVIGYFGETSGKGYTYLDDFELHEYDSPEGCKSPYFSGNSDQDQYNFVPNPGFEMKLACPTQRDHLKLCYAWRVNENTPDFYHRCGSNSAAVPENTLGTEEPHQGDAYGGFWCYLPRLADYREFISILLQHPLKKGDIYCLSMWVSLAEVSAYALPDLQMLPARSTEYTPSDIPANDPRMVFLSDQNQILDEHDGWTKISALFIANGGERVLTIGNFRKNDDPKLKKLTREVKPPEATFNNSCYYYVDDVTLCELEAPIADCPDNLSPQIIADPDFPELPMAELEVDTVDTPEEVSWLPGDTLVLENFLFEFDASQLTGPALPILDTLTAYLSRHPELRIIVTGHTDNQGKSAYNEKLSLARANSVLNYLGGKGLARKRMQAEGKGERVPLAPNDDEEGRARNRRVEVRFRYHF